MDIQLSQNEIKEAISQYVGGHVGIDMSNKKLDITFSATRYEGTIAKLSITSLALAAAAAPATIPGYNDGTAEAGTVPAGEVAVTASTDTDTAAPAATIDEQAASAEAKTEAIANTGTDTTAAEAPIEAAPIEAEAAEVPEATPAAEAKPKNTATLFGKPATA